MFGMGMWEIVLIAVVALLALGPDKLPQAAKTISKGIRDFRKGTRELQETLEDDHELGDALRDLKSALRGEEMSPSERLKQREQQAEAAGKSAAESSMLDDAQGDDETAADPGDAQDAANPDEQSGDDEAMPLITPAANVVAKEDESVSDDDAVASGNESPGEKPSEQSAENSADNSSSAEQADAESVGSGNSHESKREEAHG